MNISAVCRRGGLAFLGLVFALFAAVGCAMPGGGKEPALSQFEFYAERYPEAPLAVPVGFEDRIAGATKTVMFGDAGEFQATKIYFWSNGYPVPQRVCIRFATSDESTIPVGQPSLICRADLLASVDGVEVMGYRDKMDPKLLNAKWERLGPIDL